MPVSSGSGLFWVGVSAFCCETGWWQGGLERRDPHRMIVVLDRRRVGPSGLLALWAIGPSGLLALRGLARGDDREGRVEASWSKLKRRFLQGDRRRV